MNVRPTKQEFIEMTRKKKHTRTSSNPRKYEYYLLEPTLISFLSPASFYLLDLKSHVLHTGFPFSFSKSSFYTNSTLSGLWSNNIYGSLRYTETVMGVIRTRIRVSNTVILKIHENTTVCIKILII